MNRQKFLSLIGLSFFGTIFYSARKTNSSNLYTNCNDPITPPVPEGPFYKNEKLKRINITENKTGVNIDYLFKVEDKNCKPIVGAIVDIWQCDSDGVYSDFKQENTSGQTWLRGYQVTDKHGECRFTSIFPGWYLHRLTHIHAKVRAEGGEVLTTNLFFKKEIENQVYQNPLYPRGTNPLTVLEDFELKVDKDTIRHDTLLMNVTTDKKGKLTAKYKFALV